MTDGSSDGARTGDFRPRSSDVAIGLVASLAWSAITVVRVGLRSTSLSLVVMVFGCASVSGVPIVVVARSLRRAELRGATRALAVLTIAALVALSPIAVLSSMIKANTHHRALGAVTLATGAVVIIVAALLVSRRVFGASATGDARGRALRSILVIVALGSLLWTFASLVGPASTSRIRWAAWDGAFGASCLAPSSVVRPLAVSGPLARGVPDRKSV